MKILTVFVLLIKDSIWEHSKVDKDLGVTLLRSMVNGGLKKSLKAISLTMLVKYKALGLIPGTKLCITCCKAISLP